MMIWTKRPVFAAVIAMAGACALLLALPGETVTTKYVNDLFVFLDGAHRVMAGQVPNRDFHTALGPLAYYIPAAGYWLSGSFGAAMPLGMALLILALAPIAAHILASRLRPALALTLAAFLLLVAAAPINTGESIASLSFAMFYNRIGWAALGFLLVMYLAPSRSDSRQTLADAACAAVLVLVMIYSKISYGAVGVAFLLFMLLDPRQRRWAALALGLVLAAGLAIEAFWGGTAAHLADLRLASRVSGELDGLVEMAQTLLLHLPDLVLFALILGLTLWRTRSLRDLLFFGFSAASGFLLLTQNFQIWGIVTLGAAAAVAVERLARADAPEARERQWSMTAGANLFLLAFLLPTTAHNALALGLHTGLASFNQGREFPLPNFDRIRLVQLWSSGDYPNFSRYLATLQDGAGALASLDQAERVLVLDFVSPFSAGLGLEPPEGDSAWYHWGRTLDDRNHLPAERLFRDVQVVMDPKTPVEHWTADGLRRVYADYLSRNYELARETAEWRIHVRRSSDDVAQSTGARAER